MTDLTVKAPYLPTTQTTFLSGRDDKLVAVTTQDVEPIIEANKKLTNEGQRSDMLPGRHVARVPNNVINQWLADYGRINGIGIPSFTPDFWQFCRRRLDDPDFKFLRVDSVKPTFVGAKK